jgi:hypothetical protein
MAYRKNGYLYRSVRRGGRVKSEYLGHDPAAELAEKLDGEDRERRLAALAGRRELEEAEAEAFQAARREGLEVDRLLALGLTAAGFHRAQRRCWRRRRETMGSEVQATEPAVAGAMTDLARLAEKTFLERVAGSPEMGKKVARKMASLRAELCGADPTPALRLAVEAAALAWLDFYIAQLMQAMAQKDGVPRRLDRRLGWTQARYTRALSTVETIRRLTRPRGPRYAIQIIQNGATPAPPALDVEAGRSLEAAQP